MNYHVENCTCSDVIEKGNIIALQITPNEDYTIKIKSSDGDIYSDGYVMIPVDMIEEQLSEIEAIPTSDIPQPIPEPEPETDVDDSTALAEITEVIDDDER